MLNFILLAVTLLGLAASAVETCHPGHRHPQTQGDADPLCLPGDPAPCPQAP